MPSRTRSRPDEWWYGGHRPGLFRGRAWLWGLPILLGACAYRPDTLPPPDPGYVNTLNRIDAHPCNPTLASALMATGIPATEITEILYSAIEESRDDDDRLSYYKVWLQLEDQPGYVVVDLAPSPTCQLHQIYTMYGARLPDAPGEG